MPTNSFHSHQRQGLYGGSFDPFHWGHVHVAYHALTQLSLNRLSIIPAYQSPLKSSTSLLPNQRQRLIESCVPVLNHLGSIDICDIEFQKSEPSYTISTVEWFIHQYPDTEFIWILGADSLVTLDKWKDWERLTSLVEFAVVPRDDYSGDMCQDYWRQELNQPDNRLHVLSMNPIEISSTSFWSSDPLQSTILPFSAQHQWRLL